MSTATVTTITVPSTVKAVCRAMAGAQFKFLTTAAIWAHTVGRDQFEPTPAARAIIGLFPDLSEKTIANYLRSALRLAKAHHAVIEANPEADTYAKWLKAEADKLGYTKSEPDLMAMVSGKASAAQVAKLNEETRQRNADVAAASALSPVLGDAANKAQEGTETGTPKAEPTPGKAREEMGADAPPAPTIPPLAPIVAAPVGLFSVVRNHDGSLAVTINPEVTRAELVDISLVIESELSRMMEALTETVAPMIGDKREPATAV